MNALEYANRKIYFSKSSPIQGAFNESKYPFIAAPIVALDDIHCKCLVVYGPTQSLKSVYLQIATAYRLDQKRKTVLAVAQTDSDAKEFATIKLNPFLQQIPTLRDTVKKGPYAITLNHWLWATHELIISGPGENAQQSKSAPFLHTDEAHVWCVQYPGALASLENRMGGQWDRAGLHVTTAADANTEIDNRYYDGRQNELHQSCTKCQKLIWPIWINDDRNPYNGEEIFHWKESQSETATLDSIHVVCPHCSTVIHDTPTNRREMDEGSRYKAMNPGADRMFNSFRWNAFAPRWKRWRELFQIYRASVQKAKLGDLAPYVDWVKKQEVRTNSGEFPMMDRSTVFISHKWPEDIETARFASIDNQAGKQGEAPHQWIQVDEFNRNGDSKRLYYGRATSWAECRKITLDYSVQTLDRPQIGVDCGYNDKEVYGRCAEWKWIAMKGDDAIQFDHYRTETPGQPQLHWTAPYSMPWMGNSQIGKASQELSKTARSIIPPGFCMGIFWSNPTIYGYFHALRNGLTVRHYEIPSDFSKDYIDNYGAFVPYIETDRKTNTPKRELWKCIKPGSDHPWDTSCQNLTLAILNGFYPLEFSVGD